MSNSILKQILVQGQNGPEAVLINGDQIKATSGETFEEHSADVKRHIAAIPDVAGKALVSKADGSNEWIDLLVDAALTGTPTAPTAPAGTNTTQVATVAYVEAAVNAVLGANDAMLFKGVVSTASPLPDADYQTGWTYKVAEAGTYAGQKCQIGDMVICVKDFNTTSDNADWVVIQVNIDGAVTGPASAVSEDLALFDGATGKMIKDSGISAQSVSDSITKSHEHTSALSDIEDAVSKRHAHTNSANLDKIGETADGSMTYNGKVVTGARTVSSLEDASAAGAPQGTIFFVVEQQTA